LGESLKDELESQLSYQKLLIAARKRGFEREPVSKSAVIDWLLQNGFSWKEYELYHNPYIELKRRICRFFGIKKGWTVMDIGCGSGGTSVAAASLVGNEGHVLAVDHSEEEITRCIGYVRKVGFEGIIETKLANAMDLEFENDSFDMILLLYSPQFLGYLKDLNEVLLKIRNWTKRIGVADHIPAPSTFQESIYLLYNWLSNDANRLRMGKKTDRLFHPEEIRNALKETGWNIIAERQFRVSKSNSYPESAMKENVERLFRQIKTIEDSLEKEILLSRLRTIRDLTEKGLTPKPTSMLALVAERKEPRKNNTMS